MELFIEHHKLKKPQNENYKNNGILNVDQCK